MNVEDLTKEQKVMASAGAVALLIVILLIIVLKSGFASTSVAKEELERLKTKVENAEMVVVKKERVMADYHRTIYEMNHLLTQMPPEQNYYSWATELVYKTARSVGLEIETVDEVKRNVPKKAGNIKIESYSLRIMARGGLESILWFLDSIEHSHPLMRVTDLEISEGLAPDMHDVKFSLQWPFNLGYLAKNWENISLMSREDLGIKAPPAPEVSRYEQPPVQKAPVEPAKKKRNETSDVEGVLKLDL